MAFNTARRAHAVVDCTTSQPFFVMNKWLHCYDSVCSVINTRIFERLVTWCLFRCHYYIRMNGHCHSGACQELLHRNCLLGPLLVRVLNYHAPIKLTTVEWWTDLASFLLPALNDIINVRLWSNRLLSSGDFTFQHKRQPQTWIIQL